MSTSSSQGSARPDEALAQLPMSFAGRPLSSAPSDSSPHPADNTKLSPPQLEAVHHRNGPVVVFSGAGSGKTRVIVSRIARLIDSHHVHPRSICALTFTNKAALEMRERAQRLTPKARYCLISTFHSASARWLREYGSHIGFDSTFSILSSQESDVLLKQILKALDAEFRNLSPEEHEDYLSATGDSLGLKKHRHFIQKLKMQALTPEIPYTKVYCLEFGPAFAFKVYENYQRMLRRTNSMDFADLLLNTLTLLKSNPQVKQALQERYHYFLVDEYQDVNPTQFELISHLVPPPHNLMVVGDDDQSIYSWRGADPKNIVNFKQSYPSTKVIHLEQNYRSTGNIIAAAGHLISHNKIRVNKKLWTQNHPGDHIDHYLVRNGAAEARKICELIRVELHEFDLSQIAIFYRTNAQSREIEDAFIKQQIPYKIYGSLRFYDRLEIRDMLAYMRLAVNPKDDAAFLRIIKAPSRKIGPKKVEELSGIGADLQLSLYETLQYLAVHKESRAKISSRLSTIVGDEAIPLSKLFGHLRETDLRETVSTILRHVPYQAHLKKHHFDSYSDKLENLDELSAAMSAYYEHDRSRQLSDWVQDISLVGSEQEDVSGVSLMTLHAAKGLEFPRVYMIGCDEGLLPHKKVLAPPSKKDDPEAKLKHSLEEERRLMYVGMTRAKIKLSLISASERRSFYDWQHYRPSRFLKEIPEELLYTHYEM